MPVIMDCLKNVAGHNIASYLRKEYGLDDMIKTVDANVLDFVYNGECDYIIVPSTHRSEQPRKTLTVHVPGNWADADMGGMPRTLNISYGSKMKTVLMNIERIVKMRGLDDVWDVRMEVDHHGPTLDHPIMFVEIGSTIAEWNDPVAVRVVGDAIVASLDDDSTYTNVVGYGGGHYAPRFTKHELLEDGPAYAHLCPKYVFDRIDYSMFKQAIEKSVEPVERIEVEKKGLTSGQKKRVREWCELYGIEYREIR